VSVTVRIAEALELTKKDAVDLGVLLERRSRELDSFFREKNDLVRALSRVQETA